MAGWSEPPERSVERDEALALALPQVPALGWGWRATLFPYTTLFR